MQIKNIEYFLEERRLDLNEDKIFLNKTFTIKNKYLLGEV